MAASTLGSTAPSPRLTPILVRVAAYTLVLSVALFALLGGTDLTTRLFLSQDLPVLVLGAFVLLLLSFWRAEWRMPAVPRPGSVAVVLAIAVLGATWLGTWLVFGDYALSRDEILANFDSNFLAHGRLIAPIPVEWRAFSSALMPQFMLPVSSDAGWLSGYLPINAGLRALGRLTLGAEAVNPLLACLSVIALYRIGRRLWPEHPTAPLVPVIVLVTSSQFLTMAMTPFAMTAHLALNLCWLWGFLRGDRKGDLGALLIGFCATGVHQLLFHPLFVLPFIARLWFTGQRARAIFYVVGYAVIGLFWIFYWQIVLAGSAAVSGQAGGNGVAYLFSRLVTLIETIRPTAASLMLLNLLRFVAWQNLLLVPLALIGCLSVKRGDGIARPLAAGIGLTFLAMLVLLPWQGHGWGYRYLHGLLGSFCLLAGYGWQLVTERRRYALFALGTAASLLAILPLHLWQAHDLVRPYREAYATITRSQADVVVVDSSGLLLGEDLVRNLPDLSNRPKIMDLGALNGPQLQRLCASYRIEIFDIRQGRQTGIPLAGQDAAYLHARQMRRSLLERRGCGAPLGSHAEMARPRIAQQDGR